RDYKKHYQLVPFKRATVFYGQFVTSEQLLYLANQINADIPSFVRTEPERDVVARAIRDSAIALAELARIVDDEGLLLIRKKEAFERRLEDLRPQRSRPK